MLVLVAIFAAITIEANLRGRKPTEDYGRLYGRQIESVNAVPAKPVVVEEAPIPDQAAADPTLIDSMRREQILHAEVPVAVQSNVQPRVINGKIAIVGGPEGVGLVQSDRKQPVLRGGFGR